MCNFKKMISNGKIEDYYNKLWSEIELENSIYFFGATNGYKCAMDWIHSKCKKTLPAIKGILNNDSNKWDSYIDDILVISPDKLFNDIGYHNEIILITCGSAGDIVPQLMSYNVPEERIKIFTIMPWKEANDFRYYLHNHLCDFEIIYDMLDDNKSKEVFINLINFKLTGDFSLIKTIADPFDNQYFDEGLIKYHRDDVYLDCGAYIGDTINNYIKHNKGLYSKIISLEANPKTYNKLVENTKENTNVICINKGIWNKKCSLRFTNDNYSEANTVSDNGDIIIECDTIDSILGTQRVNHIKMDIEGAEVPALIGAFETIQHNRPSLAICVYHKNGDFVKIPFLIKSINPDYKLYFRQYQRLSAQETVCYAIINNANNNP